MGRWQQHRRSLPQKRLSSLAISASPLRGWSRFSHSGVDIGTMSPQASNIDFTTGAFLLPRF
jgi:hypothetical protein